jgi:hypothetical protein
MKTKRSNKNANVETLRVRYAELLRLREDVQRLEASCHTVEQKDCRARVAIIRQRGSGDGRHVGSALQ